MTKEQEVIERVRKYLANLGYRLSQIKQEVPVGIKRVDLVAYEGDTPWVVVEVKSSSHALPDKETSELAYNPLVRGLQESATKLGAPYYLLSNGASHLWFRTDKSSGRPRLLAEAVSAPSISTSTGTPKNEAKYLLAELNKIVRSWAGSVDPLLAGKVILAQLMHERGEVEFREALLFLRRVELPNLVLDPPKISPNNTEDYTRGLKEAFSWLDGMPLRTFNRKELLAAVDQMLLWNRYYIPSYVSSLMVRLAQLERGNVVHDLWADGGEILAAVLDTDQIQVWGVCKTVAGAIQAKIRLEVLGSTQDHIFMGALIERDGWWLRDIPMPTHIISVPPFGTRSTHLKSSSLKGSIIRDVTIDDIVKHAPECVNRFETTLTKD